MNRINNSRAGCAFIIITLFLFAFVNFDGATSFLPMVVPHIEGHVVVIHFSIMIGALLFFFAERLLTTKKIRVDIVAICLLIKCVLDSIPMLTGTVDNSVYFWYYAITISSFVTYFILSNCAFRKEQYKCILYGFIIFGIIISLQVIYTFFNSQYTWLDIRFKNSMVIPYGGTNIIASILVPIICLIFLNIKKPVVKYILIVLLSISIIITKSRGGILLGLMVLFFLAYKQMRKRKNKILSILFGVLSIVVLVFAIFQNTDVQTMMSGYSSVSSRNGLDALLSGRIDTWNEAWGYFVNGNHQFFGIGMQTLQGYASGAHNILIDLLLKAGIIGSIVYIVALITLHKRALKSSRSFNDIRTWQVMGIVILINSLFEVCYFSYACDTMFWMINGILSAQCYKNRIQSEDKNELK